MFLYRPSENIVDADRKLYRRTFSDCSTLDKRIPPRTLPIVEVSLAAFLYIGQHCHVGRDSLEIVEQREG